jgi:hypothetical protein
MALFTPDSSSTMPVMDTEDGSMMIGTAAGGSGKRRATPFDFFSAVERDDSIIFDEFVSYNEDLSLSKCVHRVQPRRPGQSKEKSCSCLKVLQESPRFVEAVAEYQVYFGGLNRRQKQMIVIEWIRYSQHYGQTTVQEQDQFPQRTNSSLLFPIPFVLSEEEDHDNDSTTTDYSNLRVAKICRDALMDLLGVGKDWWFTCIKHGLNNTVPNFKLKGRKANNKRRWDEMYFDSLVEHFEELRKEAGPIATRFVREKTGETTTRDDNEKLECLTPDFSKRQCYYKYCRSRGVKVSANNKGNLNVERPPIDDAGEGGESSSSLSIPSWGAYQAFWKKEYPNLRVSRPVEDICSYCYTFQNSFRYKKRSEEEGVAVSNHNCADDDDDDDDDGPHAEVLLTDAAAAVSSSAVPHCLPTTTSEDISSMMSSRSDEDEATNGEEEDHVIQQEEEVLVVPAVVLVEEEDVDDEVLQREKMIDDAVKHVKMARAQRLLVNEKAAKAKEDCLAKTIHSERTHTFIVDYGQNMTLPWFGTSQPGDTYYYTPLTIFNLGVVDVSHPDGEHLYCHIYKEGDGKKGGDNVASLLVKSLRQLNVLQEGCRGKELNVVFDNCPGQNKNHHVLWLVPYLVEMGYFHTVNFIFLVVGHTKNAADRRFNNLKMIYRKSNVYTFNQLLQVCGGSPHVTVVPVVDGDFKDYDYFFDLFYGRIAAVTKSHIFSCKRPSDGSVYTDGVKLMVSVKESNLDEHPTKTTNLIKPNMMLFNGDGTEGSLQEAVASRLSLLQRADFLDPLPFKGIPEFKQVQLYRNYRKFVPAPYQDEICPKPSEEVLKRQKDDQKNRLDAKKAKKEQLMKQVL